MPFHGRNDHLFRVRIIPKAGCCVKSRKRRPLVPKHMASRWQVLWCKESGLGVAQHCGGRCGHHGAKKLRAAFRHVVSRHRLYARSDVGTACFASVLHGIRKRAIGADRYERLDMASARRAALRREESAPPQRPPAFHRRVDRRVDEDDVLRNERGRFRQPAPRVLPQHGEERGRIRRARCLRVRGAAKARRRTARGRSPHRLS